MGKNNLPTLNTLEQFMTMKEVAQRLGIGISSTYRLADSKKYSDPLPTIQIGGVYRIRPVDFDAWVERHTSKPLVTESI